MDFVFAVLHILKQLAFAQQNSYSVLQMLHVFSMGIELTLETVSLRIIRGVLHI